FAQLDGLVFLNAKPRAVNNVVALLLASLFVDNGDQTAAVHGNQVFSTAAHDVQIDEANEAAVAGFEFRLFGNASRRSSDVERAHRELSARFADGLGRDDANGL